MRTIAFTFLLCFSVHSGATSFSVQGDSLTENEKISVSPGKKGLVLTFLSSQCPCSDSHVVELSKLKKDFPEFEFVAIHSNQDENQESAKTYFVAKNLPFPVIRDAKAVLADKYKALKTPHAYVLDPEGKILYKGGVSDSASFEKASRQFLRESLTELRQNKKIQNPETRTLGCIISRQEPG